MWVITVYGFECRAGTRITIGCEDMAECVSVAAEILGYTTRVTYKDRPICRTPDEEARADRLVELVAPMIFGPRQEAVYN